MLPRIPHSLSRLDESSICFPFGLLCSRYTLTRVNDAGVFMFVASGEDATTAAGGAFREVVVVVVVVAAVQVRGGGGAPAVEEASLFCGGMAWARGMGYRSWFDVFVFVAEERHVGHVF